MLEAYDRLSHSAHCQALGACAFLVVITWLGFKGVIVSRPSTRVFASGASNAQHPTSNIVVAGIGMSAVALGTPKPCGGGLVGRPPPPGDV